MWHTIEGVGRLPVEGDGMGSGAGLDLGKRRRTSRCWKDARKGPLLGAGLSLTGVLGGVIQRAKPVQAQALPEIDPGCGSRAAGRRMLQASSQTGVRVSADVDARINKSRQHDMSIS